MLTHAPRLRRQAPATPVRVASVPAGHVYVRHLADPDGPDGVVRLPDVPPPDGRKVPGGWWPPAMLDAAWIDQNSGSFDVFHVHFGFDAKTPDELREVVRALRRARVPLVVTVHDLRNPHHSSPEPHDEQLSVLIDHADALITLTRGAARAIAARWGRCAQVLPHPHVVDLERIAAPRPPRSGDGPVFGLHAKSFRRNMDVVGVAETLAGAVAGIPGTRLRIDVHDEVFDPGAFFYAPAAGARLRELAAEHPEHVELRVHPYFSDEELWEYFEAIDVSVLPYRFGTHSGWLEACFDLGTAVVAPTCGFYAQQEPVVAYRHDERDGLDRASLAEAVATVAGQAGAGAPRADAGARRAQRRALARAHRDLYDRVLEG
jgi:glycosyltransferase involved in cell wall biosynthesis